MQIKAFTTNQFDMTPKKEKQPGDYAASKGATIREVVRCPDCRGKGKVDGEECTTCYGDGMIPSSISNADKKNR